MEMLFKNACSVVIFWARDRSGLAATEFVIVFPMLFMMLLGTVELGNGIMANQKTIMASQIVNDLMTRSEEVTTVQIDEAKSAGRLALNPFEPTAVGFDIVSVRFVADSADAGTEPDPEIVWRETDNMGGYEAAEEAIKENVLPLALVGDGLVMVSVRYPYTPAFGSRFVGNLNMIETTFARGRKSPVVYRAGS